MTTYFEDLNILDSDKPSLVYLACWQAIYFFIQNSKNFPYFTKTKMYRKKVKKSNEV